MTKLPTNWEQTKMGEIGRYLNGKAFKSDEWKATGRPIIRIQNLTGSGSEYNYFQGEVDDRYVVMPGDLLFSWSATLGTYIWQGPEAVLNQHIFKVESLINKKFHRYLLDFKIQEMQSQTHGSGMVHITKKSFDAIEVHIPPIDEQNKIVEILEEHLSRLDEAIADVKQAKEKATQFKRSLLLAGLSGTFNNEPKDSKSGLPSNWKRVTLGDVADWSSGGTPSSKDTSLYGGEIPWIVIGDLTESVVMTTEKTINKKGLDSSSAKILPRGTVMVAMYGASIGRTGVMGKDMATNQAIACGKPKDGVILENYLLYYLQSQKQAFIRAGKGGAQPNISQGVVKEWEIPLPPISEQQLILNEIENQLAHLNRATESTSLLLDESSSLRRSILQAAFTGKLAKEVASV